MALAHDAGFGKLSFTSALAGMLCAFGCFAVLAAIAGIVLRVTGVESTEDISGDWRDVGVGTGIALAIVLFLSYLFGGYVAGRMARRAGALNGLLAFVLGVLVVAGIGAAVGTQTDTDTMMSNLRSIGVPTSGEEWAAIGSIAGAVALACMLLGSILGGMLGERWHGKLLTRALDPSYGGEVVDVRDRDADVRTLDDDRAETRDRTLVASGSHPDGAHYDRGHDHLDGDDHVDRDRDGRTGVDEVGDGWDGDNSTRRYTDTSTSLDDDLHRDR
jgi:hypothetical protein